MEENDQDANNAEVLMHALEQGYLVETNNAYFHD